ncbi:hypothetical protein GOBAR_AA03416 [Gossypium barbadense]|uniref:Uncharacterized protein n=1 Tax=Gossypium barbadense TaxID=3634 RepID=A0A2P5YNK1_GOSBA|nr:hypothetical protein GOBAR_AA03416 [Gossypium barbadense]
MKAVAMCGALHGQRGMRVRCRCWRAGSRQVCRARPSKLMGSRASAKVAERASKCSDWEQAVGCWRTRAGARSRPGVCDSSSVHMELLAIGARGLELEASLACAAVTACMWSC